MGEIADEHYDRMIDEGYLPVGDYFFGRRSQGSYGRSRSAYGQPLKCKHCGSTEVYWQRVKGEHKLYDKSDLTPHNCNKQQMNTEGFDDVV